MVAEQYVTTAELAEMAGVDYIAISKLCAKKALPAIRKGKIYLIPRYAARVYLRKVEAERRLREICQRFYSEEAR
jgi:predicted transcriptional regulator